MKSILLSVFSLCSFLFFNSNSYAAGNVTITSVAVPAGNMNQNSNTNILYIAKLDVSGANLSINTVNITIDGNYSATDFGNLSIFFNAASPAIAGASLLNNAPANFAGPHSFSVAANANITAATTGYIIITINTMPGATDNHTAHIDGAVNPLTIIATGSPTITNSQTNTAGVQTIQAADITLTTVAVPAANVNQGSNSNIIYIAKMDVATEPIAMNKVIFNLTGSYDNDDLGNVSIYFSFTAPTLASASLLNNAPGNFSGPHLFSIDANANIAAGTSGYIIITANATNSATDNHTLNINGATDPITIAATTIPNFVNNQTNTAGVQTIQAADITLTTVAVPAANVNQGSNSNIIYIAKMDVATEPIAMNKVIFNLTGSYDNDDLGNVSIYFSFTAPTLASASLLNNAPGNFSGPHLFSIDANANIAAGTSGYIIITANATNSATDNHTLNINGATDPITITATTIPNFVNNQTNTAGVQTIQAADITLTTVALPAANINQGSSSNIVYIAKMDVATEPIAMNKVIFNLTGSYDNDDLGNVSIYFSFTAPTLASASLLNNAPGNFAGPHLFSIDANANIAAGTSGYIIITANATNSATDNHTLNINGATDPITITATTIPNFVNNQTNTAGVQTIRAAGIILTSVTLPATNIIPGSNSNIIYTVKMDVGTQPVVLNNAQITLSGNYNAADLTTLSVLFNSTAPTLAGAMLLNNAAANVAGPHTFSIPATANINAGTTGYILFAVNVSSGSTIGNTVSVNGAANPVVFGFTTIPTIINDQSNLSGVFYFSTTTLPLKLTSFTANKITGQNQVQLNWITSAEINTKNFNIEWSTDGLSYTTAGNMAAQGNSPADVHYTFTHTTPAAGINYYRLKMIDIDGKFTFSPVVTVQLNNSHAVMIAPNPVSTQLRIVLNNTSAIKTIRVYDMSGKIIWQSAGIISTGIITIPFNKFGKGMYSAEVTTQNGIERLPFIKAGK